MNQTNAYSQVKSLIKLVDAAESSHLLVFSFMNSNQRKKLTPMNQTNAYSQVKSLIKLVDAAESSHLLVFSFMNSDQRKKLIR